MRGRPNRSGEGGVRVLALRPARRALVAAAGGLEVGAGLIAGDEEVGTVTSVAPHPAGGDVGLGYLGRAVAPPAELEARGAGGSIAVTALATPLAD